MSTDPDLYAVLGVKKDASIDEVRRAYRRMAIKLHPDRNPEKDAELKFKTVSAAYDVLSDQDKRTKYDRERIQAQRPPPPPPNYPVARASVEVDLDGFDLKNGCDKTVTVSRPRQCPDCYGTGRLARSQNQTCVLCSGAGCITCAGFGWVTTNHCSRCWSSGTDRELAMIVVHVPPGTPPYGRQRFIASGNLWGLRGPFYIDANVTYRVKKPPGLIVR
jgi:molecular chaperone DnaJ